MMLRLLFLASGPIPKLKNIPAPDWWNSATAVCKSFDAFDLSYFIKMRLKRFGIGFFDGGFVHTSSVKIADKLFVVAFRIFAFRHTFQNLLKYFDCYRLKY